MPCWTLELRSDIFLKIITLAPSEIYAEAEEIFEHCRECNITNSVYFV